MIIHNFEQNTPEWYEVRLGKFTGSDFHTLRGKGITKDAIMHKKAAERITGTRADADSYTNKHMERGNQLELDAVIGYELQTNNIVERVGFVELDQTTGCSPDGLVGSNGMIEIKCKDNHTFLKYAGKMNIEPTYKTQMQFNMMVCEREWCDYIVYNPNFENNIIIQRYHADNEEQYIIKEKLQELELEIKTIIHNYNNITKG